MKTENKNDEKQFLFVKTDSYINKKLQFSFKFDNCIIATKHYMFFDF